MRRYGILDPNCRPTEGDGLPPGVLAIVHVAEGPITLAATADPIWVEAHRADILTRIDPSQHGGRKVRRRASTLQSG